MARKGKRTASSGNGQVTDFRHEEATRKNKPPASIAPAYEVSERQTTRHGQAAFPCGEDVIAWFLDTDYDGKTFKIAQAFFPGDPEAWEKLQRDAAQRKLTPRRLRKCAAPSRSPSSPASISVLR